MARARALFRLLFIVFAVAATLAHICALPEHVHAAPSVTDRHAHEGPARDQDDAPADSSYAESCEALPAGSVPATPMLVAVPTAMASAEPTFRVVDRALRTTPPEDSPPLYLTHRALLL